MYEQTKSAQTKPPIPLSSLPAPTSVNMVCTDSICSMFYCLASVARRASVKLHGQETAMSDLHVITPVSF